MSIKEKAGEIKKNIIVVYILFKRRETPWYAKVMAGITIGYALSPIDLVPDFIPVLGYLDDAVILPILLLLTIKLIPRDIFEKAKLETEDLWQDGRPKKWYFAIPVLCIWIGAAVIVIKAILK